MGDDRFSNLAPCHQLVHTSPATRSVHIGKEANMWEEQHFLGADEDAEIKSTGITTNTAFSPSWFDGEGRFVSLPLGRLVGRSTAVKRRTLPSLGTASKRAFVLASRSVTWQRNVGRRDRQRLMSIASPTRNSKCLRARSGNPSLDRRLKAEMMSSRGRRAEPRVPSTRGGVNYRARSAAGRLTSTRNNSGESVVSTLKPSSRAI